MRRILVVDDVEGNRELLADMLSDSYEVDTASDGREAIEKINSVKDYCLIMLDLMMPVLDGFGVLDYMRLNHLSDKYPVVIISGDGSVETEAKCFDYGIADFIAKPFREMIILKRLKNIITLHEYQNSLEGEIARKNQELDEQLMTLLKQSKSLKEINTNIIDILGNVVESRSLESGTHVKRVKGFTKILGMQLIKDYPEYGLTRSDIEHISMASALHDIGKIAIPDNILLKPGRLTEDEFDLMKLHTTKGCAVLDSIEGIWDEDYRKTSYDICRYHHEKFDGRGYPDGLKGDDIPLSAQLVSVADVYDALTSERCYKKAYTKKEAYDMILDGQCGVFSPKLIESFKNSVGEFEKYADNKRLVL